MADVFRSPLIAPRGARRAVPPASIFPNLAVGLVVAASAPFVNPLQAAPQRHFFQADTLAIGASTLEDDPLLLPFNTLQVPVPERRPATWATHTQSRALLELVGAPPFFGTTGPAPQRRSVGSAAQMQSRLVLETPVVDPFVPVLYPTIPRRQHFSTAFPLNLQPTFALIPPEPPPRGLIAQAPADFRAHWVFATPSFAAVWRIPAAETLEVSFDNIESWVELREKDPDVDKTYTVDFISRFLSGITIVDVVAATMTWSGVDADGDSLVPAAPTAAGTKVTFTVVGGVAGVLYAVGIAAEGSDGAIEQITGIVPLRESSWP
jgi:hypothetical protein